MACLEKLAVSQTPVEEYQVNWKIAHFSEIRGSAEALKAESCPFTLVSNIFFSRWKCYLTCKPNTNGRNWICANVGLNKEVDYSRESLSKTFVTLAIEVNEGVFRSNTSPMFHVLDAKCHKLIPQDEDDPYFENYVNADGSLCLKIIINLFNLDIVPTPKVQLTLLDIQIQFESKFRENLQRDMDEIFKNPQIEDQSLGIFKVVSSDGREFFINSEILNVRCPKFLLMLTRMRKSEMGFRVPVLGVSGQTLENLLSYVYTGRLVEAWMVPAIFDELRDLARDFEMEDLHEFLEKAFELM